MFVTDRDIDLGLRQASKQAGQVGQGERACVSQTRTRDDKDRRAGQAGQADSQVRVPR